MAMGAGTGGMESRGQGDFEDYGYLYQFWRSEVDSVDEVLRDVLRLQEEVYHDLVDSKGLEKRAFTYYDSYLSS